MGPVTDATSSEAALAERARTRGWPEGLMERALAVRTPRFQLDYWLQIEPSENLTFQVTRIVEVSERLTRGPYRGRELTYRDEESFGELWANAPERVGDQWEVTVERSPNALAQFRLQPGASISVIEDANEIVACTVWSHVNCTIGGEPISIHYAQGLRVRGDRRRDGLGDLVRRFPVRALQTPTIGQVMFLRIGNAGMAGFLEAVKFQAEGERPQQTVAVAYLTASAAPASPGVRPIAESDLGACAAMINRTHQGLDLFHPYGTESLRAVLDEGIWGKRPPNHRPVYGWADLFVLEEAGRVVACAGLWDRGRDMRETWRSKDGEERRVEVAAALDVGCEAGAEAALARLLRSLAGIAHARGRQSLIVHLEHLPDVQAELSDLQPKFESRILEWSPYAPELPRQLGRCFVDLRYW
jgi:hypothetical protein